VSATFGCSIGTLLLLNNDIPNATATISPDASVCLIPDACLARAAQPAAQSFRDQDWFRSAHTQRT
jgi:hypothetical protein